MGKEVHMKATLAETLHLKKSRTSPFEFDPTRGLVLGSVLFLFIFVGLVWFLNDVMDSVLLVLKARSW